jgi:hypothetical protein
MGAKVTFDPVTRSIIVTQAPVGGVIVLDVKVDLYSDGKEDWLATPALQKLRFPIEPIGGNLVPGRVIGDSYVLNYGWSIKPWEASHDLTIVGNLFTQFPPLVDPSIGGYMVRVESIVSTLVEIRSDVSSAADLSLMRKIGTNRLVTDPTTGLMTLYDDDNVTVVKVWDIYEDVAETQPYQGQGIEVRKPQ